MNTRTQNISNIIEGLNILEKKQSLEDLVLLRAAYNEELHNAISKGNQKALDKWVKSYKSDPSNKEELSWYTDVPLDVKVLKKELAKQDKEYDDAHSHGRKIFGESYYRTKEVTPFLQAVGDENLKDVVIRKMVNKLDDYIDKTHRIPNENDKIKIDYDGKVAYAYYTDKKVKGRNVQCLNVQAILPYSKEDGTFLLRTLIVTPKCPGMTSDFEADSFKGCTQKEIEDVILNNL